MLGEGSVSTGDFLDTIEDALSDLAGNAASSGGLLEMDNLLELKSLLLDNGWTWLTALNVILFSLFHWPCSTTCLTISRETRSVKQTALAILLPTLIASAFAALYAEVLAWLLRAPTPLFLTIALVIPLIPGRSLYYATYCAVRQEISLARDYAAQTAEYALGIALGASLVWAFANMRRSLVRHDPIPR